MRDPTFSRFSGTLTCDRQTDTRLRRIPRGNYWAAVTTYKQRFAVCYTGPMSCLSVCPVCRLYCLSITLVYCGQTVGWIKMPLGMEVALGPGDIVLDGDPAPPRKGAQQPGHSSPNFSNHVVSVHVYCGAQRPPISVTAELLLILVHGQVTIIFVVSVCLSVCAEFFSAIFDPISIKLGHMLYVWV